MTLNIVERVERALAFVRMSHRGTHILVYYQQKHCVKSVHIWSFSGTYFHAFRLNAEKYGPEKLWTQPLSTQWKSSKVFKYSEIITDKSVIVILLWTGMCCWSHLLDVFLQSKQFWGKCACPFLSVYCTIKKWLLKDKFSKKYQAVPSIKIQSEHGTNNQASLKLRVSCVI